MPLPALGMAISSTGFEALVIVVTTLTWFDCMWLPGFVLMLMPFVTGVSCILCFPGEVYASRRLISACFDDFLLSFDVGLQNTIGEQFAVGFVGE